MSLKNVVIEHVQEHGSISGISENTRQDSQQAELLAKRYGKDVKQLSLTSTLAQLRDEGVLTTNSPKHTPSDGQWFFTEEYETGTLTLSLRKTNAQEAGKVKVLARVEALIPNPKGRAEWFETQAKASRDSCPHGLFS